MNTSTKSQKALGIRLSRSVMFALFAAVTTLSGCIVNTKTQSGILEVRWEISTCKSEGIETVEVTVRRNGIAEGTSGPQLCTKGFHAFAVSPGVYDVSLRAFDVSGEALATAGADQVIVNSNATSTTKVIGLQKQTRRTRTGGGAVVLSWTVMGEQASVGCAKHGISTVTVSVLNNKRTLVNAHTTLPCATGKVRLANIPAGPAYIQLDGTTTDKLTYHGNLELHGPLTIVAGADVVISKTLDIGDLRSSIELQWQFANSNTCAGNNIDEVLIEVRDANDKVVVPITAADANKPCELDSGAPTNLRVIDMMFSTPQCNVPAGAKGLVICGITSGRVGVHVSAKDKTTGQIVFGGSMELKGIPSGSHVKSPTKVSLATCTATNVCAKP
jgi:hypothetical protein